MPTTVAHIAATMQTLLTATAQQLAQETGFIQRERKINGASFAQALVLGWWSEPGSSLETLSQGFSWMQQQTLSRQALAQRFTGRAAHFLERLLQAALAAQVAGMRVELGCLHRFAGVYVEDSTVVSLPSALTPLWSGVQGAGLKIGVAWELQQGTLSALELCPARQHDQQLELAQQALPDGSLRLQDLGFFNLERLAQQAQTGYFISRYKGGTAVYDEQGERLDLVSTLCQTAHPTCRLRVQLGQQQRLSCWLVAERVPAEVYRQRQQRLKDWERKHGSPASPERYTLCQWILLLTNIPPDWLTDDQVRAVYRLRWQIELLFKSWKSILEVDDWHSQQPWRILCEVYAKLIAALFQHWCQIAAGAHALNRSLTRTAHLLTRLAWRLAPLLAQPLALAAELERLIACLRPGTRISRSRSSMPSFQRLEP
jgi:hypothetical protein